MHFLLIRFGHLKLTSATPGFSNPCKLRFKSNIAGIFKIDICRIGRDILIIVTDLLKAGRNSFTMFQKIFLKDTDMLVADAEVTNVFIDMNAGKVVPVDNEIISLWPDLGKYFNKDKSTFSKST